MQTNETPILKHLEESAKRAHTWTSFSPEKRGEQMIKEYSEELTEDIEELQKHTVSEESIADYKARYERYFTSYLGAKSRCFSAMITGPANFPTRRHEKANRSEQKHFEIFREWRIRAKKAIIRKAQPAKTFITELDRYKEELASMQRNHELMKQGNKMIARAKKEGKDISGELMKLLGINQFNAEWAMKWGFGLQNNNANMKRVEDRIKELEAKEKMLETAPVTKYTFEGGEMVINYEVDRIQIFFSNKPSKDELAAWKAKGLNTFNWSPTHKAWLRKITPNALRCVKSMLSGITKIV
jgi:hypothetical protein